MARQRSGVPTLLHIAELLCKYIVKFTPWIEELYPTNAALLAALSAANAACAALHTQLALVRQTGD